MLRPVGRTQVRVLTRDHRFNLLNRWRNGPGSNENRMVGIGISWIHADRITVLNKGKRKISDLDDVTRNQAHFIHVSTIDRDAVQAI